MRFPMLIPLLVAPAMAVAQWDSWSASNVARTADGEVDMEAPTPRTRDGRPDFSGVWTVVRHHQSGVQGRPVGEPETPPPGAPPYATFWDIEHGFPDGLPMQPWARALKEERMANESRDNPDAWCLPMGHMQSNNHLQPRKFIQTPEVLVLLNEGNAGIRQIFTDGRSAPEDPWPWWYGYSVGRWIGETLVVESTGFKDDVWLDYNGTPLTDEGKIIERFRRVNTGTMIVDMTIEDSKAYTEPFSVRIEWQLMPDTSLIEMVCLENEQSTRYY